MLCYIIENFFLTNFSLQKEIEHSPADITGLREGLSYLFKVAPKSGPTVGEFSDETIPIRVVGKFEIF